MSENKEKTLLALPAPYNQENTGKRQKILYCLSASEGLGWVTAVISQRLSKWFQGSLAGLKFTK